MFSSFLSRLRRDLAERDPMCPCKIISVEMIAMLKCNLWSNHGYFMSATKIQFIKQLNNIISSHVTVNIPAWRDLEDPVLVSDIVRRPQMTRNLCFMLEWKLVNYIQMYTGYRIFHHYSGCLICTYILFCKLIKDMLLP